MRTSMIIVFESVTCAVHGANPQISESSNRSSQPADMHVDRPAFHNVRIGPNGLNELLTGTDLTLPFQ